MSFSFFPIEEEPDEVRAVNEFAKKKGLTAVSLPSWYEISWALVDGKGLVKHWVHFLETDKLGPSLPVDLYLWRAGRALNRDTGAIFTLIISCGADTYYLSASLSTWEFGVDQESLEPMAYVNTRFLVNSTQVAEAA